MGSVELEPRPYQLEALLQAKKCNTILVGDTGIGKTLVALLMLKDYYEEEESKRKKWCCLLAPTQALVMQQARTCQEMLGRRTGAYRGKDLDYIDPKKWQEEMEKQDILVMTPAAMLNLLHKGSEFLSLGSFGMLVIDECHHAKKKHPYARIMSMWAELDSSARPRVFGMTASPTPGCVKVMHSTTFRCSPDSMAAEFAALADSRALRYTPFHPSSKVIKYLSWLLNECFSDTLFLFNKGHDEFEDEVIAPVLYTYQHIGLSCAVTHVLRLLEAAVRTSFAVYMSNRRRFARVRALMCRLKVISQAGKVKQCQKLMEQDMMNDLADQTAHLDSLCLADEEGFPKQADAAGSSSSQASESAAASAGGSGSFWDDAAEADSEVVNTQSFTPGRVESLVKILLRHAKSGMSVSNPLAFRCMVFVQRRSTSSLLCDFLNAVLGGYTFHGQVLQCGFYVGGTGGKLGGVISDDEDEDEDEQEHAEEQEHEDEGGEAQGSQEGQGVSEAGGNDDEAAGTAVETEAEGKAEEQAECILVEEPGGGSGNGNGGGSDSGSVGAGSVSGGAPKERHEEADNNGSGAADEKQVSRSESPSAAKLHDEEAVILPVRSDCTIEKFRSGQLHILVTTDACKEGIDVPACNLVIAMDPLSDARALIHMRGRARCKGGAFIVMMPQGDLKEEQRLLSLFNQSERIRQNDLTDEAESNKAPLRLKFDSLAMRVESTGASLDMDNAVSLLHETINVVGGDCTPLFTCQQHSTAGTPLGLGQEKSNISSLNGPPSFIFTCKLELPSFLTAPGGGLTIDEESFPICTSKKEARAVAAFYGCMCLYRGGFLSDSLNPVPVSQRVIFSNIDVYDKSVLEGPAAIVMQRPPAQAFGLTPVLSAPEAPSKLYAYPFLSTAADGCELVLQKEVDLALGQPPPGPDGKQLPLCLMTRQPLPLSLEVLAAHGLLQPVMLELSHAEMVKAATWFISVTRQLCWNKSPGDFDPQGHPDLEEALDKGYFVAPRAQDESGGIGIGIDWDSVDWWLDWEPERVCDPGVLQRVLQTRISSKKFRMFYLLEQTSVTLRSYLTQVTRASGGLPAAEVTNIDLPQLMLNSQLQQQDTLRLGHWIVRQDCLVHPNQEQQLLLALPALSTTHTMVANLRRGGGKMSKEAVVVDQGEPAKLAKGTSKVEMLLPDDCTQLCIPTALFTGMLQLMPRMFNLERTLLVTTLIKALVQPALEAAASETGEGVLAEEFRVEPAAVTRESEALLNCILQRPQNERLETLGDAWLNLHMSLYVFQMKQALLEEGTLSILRNNLVSNARLCKACFDRGVPCFMFPPSSIEGRPFHHWGPSFLGTPEPVRIAWKTVGDVAEAFIGGFLVAGGDSAASYVLGWLGLPTLDRPYKRELQASDASMPWAVEVPERGPSISEAEAQEMLKERLLDLQRELQEMQVKEQASKSESPLQAPEEIVQQASEQSVTLVPEVNNAEAEVADSGSGADAVLEGVVEESGRHEEVRTQTPSVRRPVDKAPNSRVGSNSAGQSSSSSKNKGARKVQILKRPEPGQLKGATVAQSMKRNGLGLTAVDKARGDSAAEAARSEKSQVMILSSKDGHAGKKRQGKTEEAGSGWQQRALAAKPWVPANLRAQETPEAKLQEKAPLAKAQRVQPTLSALQFAAPTPKQLQIVDPTGAAVTQSRQAVSEPTSHSPFSCGIEYGAGAVKIQGSAQHTGGGGAAATGAIGTRSSRGAVPEPIKTQPKVKGKASPKAILTKSTASSSPSMSRALTTKAKAEVLAMEAERLLALSAEAEACAAAAREAAAMAKAEADAAAEELVAGEAEGYQFAQLALEVAGAGGADIGEEGWSSHEFVTEETLAAKAQVDALTREAERLSELALKAEDDHRTAKAQAASVKASAEAAALAGGSAELALPSASRAATKGKGGRAGSGSRTGGLNAAAACGTTKVTSASGGEKQDRSSPEAVTKVRVEGKADPAASHKVLKRQRQLTAAADAAKSPPADFVGNSQLVGEATGGSGKAEASVESVDSVSGLANSCMRSSGGAALVDRDRAAQGEESAGEATNEASREEGNGTSKCRPGPGAACRGSAESEERVEADAMAQEQSTGSRGSSTGEEVEQNADRGCSGGSLASATVEAEVDIADKGEVPDDAADDSTNGSAAERAVDPSVKVCEEGAGDEALSPPSSLHQEQEEESSDCSSDWPLPSRCMMQLSALARNGAINLQYLLRTPAQPLMAAVKQVEESLGYSFQCPWLCLQAITHPSWTMYERLYFRDRSLSPGDISKRKANLVNNNSLAALGQSLLGVHQFLRASPELLNAISLYQRAEEKRQRLTAAGLDPGRAASAPKQLADVVEALIGAVFLDSSCNMVAVARVFWPLLMQYEEGIGEVAVLSHAEEGQETGTSKKIKVDEENYTPSMVKVLKETEKLLDQAAQMTGVTQ